MEGGGGGTFVFFSLGRQFVAWTITFGSLLSTLVESGKTVAGGTVAPEAAKGVVVVAAVAVTSTATPVAVGERRSTGGDFEGICGRSIERR